jgi:hypothetical protein
LELQARRVDVDDLIALALALDVNPSALLFPSVADGSSVALTEAASGPAFAVWDWADGVHPLRTLLDEAVDPSQVDVDEFNAADEEFRRRSRPRQIGSPSHAARIAAELLRLG